MLFRKFPEKSAKPWFPHNSAMGFVFILRIAARSFSKLVDSKITNFQGFLQRVQVHTVSFMSERFAFIFCAQQFMSEEISIHCYFHHRHFLKTNEPLKKATVSEPQPLAK